MPGRSPFIEFNRESDSADRFMYRSRQFILSSMKLGYRSAMKACQFQFKGELAMLKERHTMDFVAEAMSETRLSLDTLWIAARRDINTTIWYWDGEKDQHLQFDKKFEELMVHTAIASYNRECLGFGREDHDKPQLRPLECEARRGFICEKTGVIDPSGMSTHRGWIKIGRREYKILSVKVPYDVAASRCFSLQVDSNLAVITDFNTSEQLGRYLLIGRPSLENAWIGARWKGSQFEFEPETIPLNNKTVDNFPPWRKSEIQKAGGCILLDRHLSNVTLFVEANCNRERAVICYRKINESGISTESFDIIIDERGYRVQLNAKPWREAVSYCKDNYPGKKGKLVEIVGVDVLKDLIYIMSENRTALHHIWIGGKFYLNDTSATTIPEKWKWDSNGDKIDVGLVKLLDNDTYDAFVEDHNNCLNMDRENHLVPLFYGTICEFSQIFICQFTAENLRKIQDEERAQAEKQI
ncbi:hypothetical protein ILUMI_11875 [Ignelater luminosus]|uniref:C-type lectin domain-containing protein n=1 Tax=Ignelater luminosus TaxID=2038154 RepID=A0A8K0GDI2_IGNLU|nr:hypothetical protein ILUMI_11875 [Ignelater luminosus]